MSKRKKEEKKETDATASTELKEPAADAAEASQAEPTPEQRIEALHDRGGPAHILERLIATRRRGRGGPRTFGEGPKSAADGGYPCGGDQYAAAHRGYGRLGAGP